VILRRPASRTTVSTRDLVSVLTIPELYHGVASKSEWSLEFTSDPWTVRGSKMYSRPPRNRTFCAKLP
jgi:hypothetical protein